jgi:hypothetical protein
VVAVPVPAIGDRQSRESHPLLEEAEAGMRRTESDLPQLKFGRSAVGAWARAVGGDNGELAICRTTRAEAAPQSAVSHSG